MVTDCDVVTHRCVIKTRLTIILVLFLALKTEGCPDRCLCYFDQGPSSVTCANQGLQRFPEDLRYYVQFLDLSGNLLDVIPDSIRLILELQYLNVAQNRLTELPSSLHGLDKLERLDVSGNYFTSVSSLASIGHLSNLKILYLNGNSIGSLQGLTSSSLQALDAGNCGIKVLGNTTLDGLSRLVTLSLAGNPLSVVNKPQSKTLRWLEMSDCRINYLEPDSLKNLPNLEELRLSNNPTLVFSTRYDTLTHEKLKRLDASRCNLDRPGIHGMPSLTHVILSSNVIRILPDKIFSKNKELLQLSLNGNSLDRLNTSSFSGLPKLTALDLSGNTLRNVHWRTFQENLELKLLNLSYNSITEFPNLTTTATSLDLSSNLIERLKSNALGGMPRLKSLNLSNNRLENLPDQLDSQTLMILNLKQNRFIRLNNLSLVLLPELQRLDLSGNRLTVAPNPSVFHQNLYLQKVFLEDNPWGCDCENLYEAYLFLTEPPPKTVSQSLVCHTPGNVTGLSWENACYDFWAQPSFGGKDRAWGLILISLLTLVIIFGTIVSLRHAMKMKRQAYLERQELERAEARERLRLLQRRHRLEEELEAQETVEPRINPLELIGPPSYEEAVHMPRLAHSMDGLDAISVDSVPAHILGSVDNLRSKKRRTRRPRKRARSEENLAKREERRDNRRRRASLERNNSTNNLEDSAADVTSSRTFPSRRPRPRSESEGSASNSRSRPRPLTPVARHKKRRGVPRGGHSSDDEDSEANNGMPPNQPKLRPNIVIQNLTREPRSGYRPSAQESDF